MTRCEEVRPLLDGLLDDELSRDMAFEVSTHVTGCERCAEHLDTLDAIRRELRRSVLDAGAPSPEFCARMADTLRSLREEEEGRESAGWTPPGALPWRAITPLAAAAGLALLLGGLSQRLERAPATAASQTASVGHTPSPSVVVENLIDSLIDFHSAPPEPQVTEPLLVPDLERDVGVRVRLPSLQQYGAEWKGGSVVAIRDQRAAFLRYTLSNHRITVYVYNASRVPVHRSLKHRVVRDRAIYVGERRGYSIAALEHGGLGYAVATDLTDRESAELVASIH